MIKRTLAAIAVTSLTVVAFPGSAAADPVAPVNTSYAAAAKVTPGGGLTPTVTTGGALGGLLDFLTPVLDQVVDPLASGLTSLPSTLVADLVAGLTAAGYDADSPSTAQAPPSSGFPTCTAGTWNADDCYGPLVPTVSAAPLLSLGTGTLQGYAAADSTGAYAGAGTTHLLLSLLGISVGDLGVATSSSQCLASRVCSSTATLAGMSLLNGAVSLHTRSDGTLRVSFDGESSVNASSVTSPVTISAAGVAATVKAQGAALRVNISLTLDNLLAALGIANVLTSLSTSVVSTAITLSLTVGPTTSSTGTTASAAGLELGIGLSADVQLSVLGLATVGLAVTDGSATGNLVDLQLAYTSATDTDATEPDPSGAPPALT